MKYLFILITTLILTSSCCGTQKITENQPKTTDQIGVLSETPSITEFTKAESICGNQFMTNRVLDNSIEVSLGENGTVSDDSISETTEIIYKEAFNHSIFNDLLKKHVSKKGNVNYNGFKTDSKTLQNYIELLKTYQPTENWTKTDKLAYWINAYNALTIDLILRNYPTKSIKDIKSPWDQRLWKFGDKWQNLNDIEHKILRKMNEPRIHFAIVCASVSCPKLQNEAFIASKLEAQLTNATKEFLADTTIASTSNQTADLESAPILRTSSIPSRTRINGTLPIS